MADQPNADQPAPMFVNVDVEPLEASIGDDDEFLDTGSVASSSTSITSSITKYREENGRTYHAFREGRYVLPNDEMENNRLDLQHHLFLLTFDKRIYTCPAGHDKSKPLGRVLDAGTGTGIWAVDFADDHPETHVTGVDLSPIQPAFIPPNVTFFIDDIEDEWNFTYKFDFIYARMLTGSLADWPKFMDQSYNNLNPGGWIEIADILLDLKSDDGTVTPDCPAAKWGDLMLEAAANWNRPLDSPKFYKEQLTAAGFINVHQTIYKWPSNSWPKDPKFKELGMWTYENLGIGASGLSLALFTRALGWSADQVEVFLVDVRKAMKNRAIHSYWPIYVVYAQKPERPAAS